MATLPSQAAFAAGEKLTAAKLTATVTNSIGFLINPPRATLQLVSTAQSIPDNAHTSIIFDTEAVDTDNMIDLVTFSKTAIRIITPGTYDILGQTSYMVSGGSSTGGRMARITVNGTAIAIESRQAAQTNVVQVNTMVQVSAQSVTLANGDVIRLTAYQNSGVAIPVSTASGERPFLSARWVAS